MKHLKEKIGTKKGRILIEDVGIVPTGFGGSLGTLSASSQWNDFTEGQVIRVGDSLKVENQGLIGEDNPNIIALFHAAKAGDKFIVKKLLSDKLSVHTTDKNKSSLLHAIAPFQSQNHKDIAQLLISKNININSVDLKKKTALHIAAESHNFLICEFLLRNGALITLPDCDGNTPIHLFIQNSSVFNHSQPSLTSSQPISFRSTSPKLSRAPLQRSISPNVSLGTLRGQNNISSSEKFLSLFQRYTTDFGIPNLEGDTFLHLSAPGSSSILNFILKSGVKVNAQNKLGQTALHIAIQNGNKPNIETLLNSGAEPNIPDIKGVTPSTLAKSSPELAELVTNCNNPTTSLLRTLKNHKGDPSTLKKIIKSKDLKLFRDFHGNSILHTAVDQGDYEIAKTLLEVEPELVYLVDSRGWSPLHLAAASGALEICSLLLSHKADVSQLNEEGTTPLHYVVRIREVSPEGKHNQLHILKEFLNAKADVNQYNKTKETALHFAVIARNIHIVEFLLQNHANPNIFSLNDETPLSLAVEFQEEEIAELLVRAGANTDVYCKGESLYDIIKSNGNQKLKDIFDNAKKLSEEGSFEQGDIESTKIIELVQIANLGVIKVLFDTNPSNAQITREGKSLLHIAVESDENGSHLQLVKYMAKKVGVNTKDMNGWTPLHLATQQGSYDICLELISKGANCDLINHENNIPLHYLARLNLLTSVPTPSPNLNDDQFVNKMGTLKRTTSGKNPFNIIKVENKNEKAIRVLQQLCQKTRNINHPNINGFTPLHYACQKGQIITITTLLESGADPNTISDSTGETPLHLAIQTKRADVVLNLLKHGANFRLHGQNAPPCLELAKKLNFQSIIPTLQALEEESVTEVLLGVEANQAKDLIVLGKNEELHELLSRDSSLIHFSDEQGTTLLHTSIEANQLACFEELISFYPNLNAVDNFGWTPLHLASMKGNLQICKRLLEEGASSDLKNVDSAIPLHYLVRNTYENATGDLLEDVFELMKKSGVNVNALNNNGFSALHLAVKAGSVRLVSILLKHGAYPNLPTVTGETPWTLAMKHQNSALDSLLRTMGACPCRNQFFEMGGSINNSNRPGQSDSEIIKVNVLGSEVHLPVICSNTTIIQLIDMVPEKFLPKKKRLRATLELNKSVLKPKILSVLKIRVTEEKDQYERDITGFYYINRKTPLIQWFNHFYKLEKPEKKERVFLTLKNKEIKTENFSLKLKRVLRYSPFPEIIPQPMELLSLYPVNGFPKASLPDNLKKYGGAVLPLYQSEAFWISLNATSQYAIRVAINGVNVVTCTPFQSKALEYSPQSHIVCPGQKYIFGHTKNGKILRQFTAIPLSIHLSKLTQPYEIELDVPKKESAQWISSRSNLTKSDGGRGLNIGTLRAISLSASNIKSNDITVRENIPTEEISFESSPREMSCNFLKQEPKLETPKEKTLKEETHREETPKVKIPTTETPNEETHREETPKVKTPTIETPNEETHREETPKVKTPTLETPNEETHRGETVKVKTPTIETSNEETHREETPKVKTPTIETPNIDDYKEETSKVEVPKIETPKEGEYALKLESSPREQNRSPQTSGKKGGSRSPTNKPQVSYEQLKREGISEMQIQLIPLLEHQVGFSRSLYLLRLRSQPLDFYKSPHELGIVNEDVIFMQSPVLPSAPALLSDYFISSSTDDLTIVEGNEGPGIEALPETPFSVGMRISSQQNSINQDKENEPWEDELDNERLYNLYPDPYRKDAYDYSRSRRYFIHILNSEAWTKMTNKKLLHHPIYPSKYIQEEIPYLPEYSEEGDNEKNSIQDDEEVNFYQFVL